MSKKKNFNKKFSKKQKKLFKKEQAKANAAQENTVQQNPVQVQENTVQVQPKKEYKPRTIRNRDYFRKLALLELESERGDIKLTDEQ